MKKNKTKQKKTKGIVNQIFLSKLCYVVQIYTIPKFKLSIWKCGLGILDIDSQLKSLELKWI